MKRTILILLAIITLAPVALRAQEHQSLHDGWGIGFQVGVGGLLPTGSLSDNFKGCALFSGGINAEYNRLRMKADVAYGQPSFKNVNPYAIYDEQGRHQQLALVPEGLDNLLDQLLHRLCLLNHVDRGRFDRDIEDCV